MGKNKTQPPPPGQPPAPADGNQQQKKPPAEVRVRLWSFAYWLPVLIQFGLLFVLIAMLVALVVTLARPAQADPPRTGPRPEVVPQGPEPAESATALKDCKEQAQKAKEEKEQAQKAKEEAVDAKAKVTAVEMTVTMSLKNLATQDELAKLTNKLEALEASNKALTARVEKLETLSKPTPVPVKAQYRRQDILIVVMNTDRLKYEEECRGAIVRLFRNQQTSPDHRLALDIVPTSLLGPKVAFGKDVVAVPDADFGLGHSTDQKVEDLDAALAQRFAKMITPGVPARLIVVASSASKCPAEKKDWKDEWVKLGARVDAILLDATPDGAESVNKENVAKWHAFCDYKEGNKVRGVCRVCGKPQDPAALADSLFTCLWELTAPIPADKK